MPLPLPLPTNPIEAEGYHNPFPGQVVTVPFIVPSSAPTQYVHVSN